MPFRELGSVVVITLLFAAFGCSGSEEPPAPSDNAGAGGTAGTDELDDPFGVGPTTCDQSTGVGGDACLGFADSAGFFSEPEHVQTNVDGADPVVLEVRTEYSPSTALKTAVEDGVTLSAYGTTVELAFEASWTATRGNPSFLYTLTPEEDLAEGWYSLVIPRAVREAHGAQYIRFEEGSLFQGGPFTVLDNGDLRADFRVGSQPLLARIVTREASASITFSEELEAEAPPVAVSMGEYDPSCSPSDWNGAGRHLELECTDLLIGYGEPVTFEFDEGFVTPGGEPLRGPDGNTEFSVDVPERFGVEFGVPDSE